MKKQVLILFISILVSTHYIFSQSNSGSFTVNGDFNIFYPVAWVDVAWNNNIATELEIGRSWVHTNSNWRGSLISKFRVH